MFGTHVVIGNGPELLHGFAVGTRVELKKDDGTSFKAWKDDGGRWYWVADENLQPIGESA